MALKTQIKLKDTDLKEVEFAYVRVYPTVYDRDLEENEVMSAGNSIKEMFKSNSKEIVDKIKESLNSSIKKEIEISDKEGGKSIEYFKEEKYIRFPKYLLKMNDSSMELRIRINPCLDSSTLTKLVIIVYCVEEDVQKFRSIGNEITRSIADVIAKYYYEYLEEYHKSKGQPISMKKDILYEFSIISIGSDEDYIRKVIENIEDNDILQELSLENEKVESIIRDIKNITRDPNKYKWVLRSTFSEEKEEKGVYGFKPITKKEGEIVGLVYGDIHNSDRSLLMEIINKI